MNVDISPINTLSICSGVGGLDLGLELATNGAARTVCFVEREAFPAAILAARMEEKALASAPIWSDLRTFDGKPWRGVVDCITGGYPCQPFSSAGKRLGEDDPRHLWPEIRRITKEIEPRFVFFENVAGHLTLGLSDVLRDLQEMGFRCSAGLFTAEEVGAPHRRERLFILGVADGNSASRSKSPDRSAERIEEESDDHGCGRELAYAESGLSGIAKGGNWRQGIRGTSAELANADRNPLERSENIKEKKNTRIGQTFEYRGGELADAVSNRSLWIGETRTTPRTTERSGRSELPDFPPGPADFDAWRRVLEQHPELAPSISKLENSSGLRWGGRHIGNTRGIIGEVQVGRSGGKSEETQSGIHRMDDGLASRVDRLRACGNGVVPLVAAYAFTTLLTCIGE